ncbi:ANTAR domain-containing protein [Streptomyces sp. ODS28]|uniref:ANTAR domain-containing protein n=1 Tax=Streptomyces sp. ODS28 TaxID=3136688 RepID=UPI0031E9C04A
MTAVLSALHGPSPGLIGGDPLDCARVLGVDGVAVSAGGSRQPGELLWATAGVSTALEDLQFTLGEGPAVEAMTAGMPVLEPDLTDVAAVRWPALLAELGPYGVAAVFCFPLQVGAACAGVLSLQRARAGPLAPAAMDDALLLADALTAVVLGNGSRLAEFAEAEPSSELYRAVVHQASGMISVQAGVPIAQALLLLRGHAYRNSRSVVEVAEDVVARRLHFRNDDNGPGPSVGKRG